MRENKLLIQINKPVSEVFEFTTNPKNTSKWIDFVEKEETNEWPIRLGCEYRNKGFDSDKWSEYVVSVLVENKVFELASKDGKFHVRYTYTPLSDSSTELEYHEWVDESELEDPFPQSAMEKLKSILEQ